MSGKNRLLSLFKVDSILENLMGYVEKRIELFKIEVKEEAVQAISKAVVLLILNVCLLMALAFISFGVAVVLNHALSHPFWGYFIVAGGYLVILVIVLTLKDQLGLEKGIQRAFIRIFDSLDAEDNEDGNHKRQDEKEAA